MPFRVCFARNNSVRVVSPERTNNSSNPVIMFVDRKEGSEAASIVR